MTSADLIQARDEVLRHSIARNGGLRFAGIHGAGVGLKEVEGRPSTTMAVRVYLPEKRARRRVGVTDRIPAAIDGVPIDVVESPPAFLCSAPIQQQAWNPLSAGISIGRSDSLYGTLAAFCRSTRSGENGRILMLSNQHVLARADSVPNEPILQPGRQDAEQQQIALRPVATLFRWQPVQPGSLANRVDAGVAALDAAFGHDPAIPGDVGRILGRTAATLNTIVIKFGRTTGFTGGVVTDLHCTMSVGLDPADKSKAATFIDQIRVDHRQGQKVFADKGDSGSLVLEQGTGKGIGLFFASPIDGSFGLVNRLEDVVERLEIELLT